MYKAKNEAGFTLIELLVVTAIIGILTSVVVVSLSSAKTNSKVAATKKTLSSLKGPIALCCSIDGASLNPTGNGGDELCTVPINSLLPTPKELNLDAGGNVSYVGTSCSVSEPSMSVLIGGHAKSECNNTWTIVENLVTSPSGC